METYASFRRLVLLSAGVLGLAFIPGCGEPTFPTAEVRGKITRGGEPIEEGTTITFFPEDGPAGGATIGPDGTYVAHVPIGTAKVALSPPAKEMSPADYEAYMTDPSASAKKQPPSTIPRQYRNPESNTEVVTVVEGGTEYNLDIP